MCVNLFAGFALAEDAPAVKLVAGDKTVEIEIGGKPFTTYHFADDVVRPFVRPFFWPVRAGDGTEVTSDQTQAPRDSKGKPADHPHHRSMWISHGDVNGVDHWSFDQKPAPAKQRHVKFTKVEGDTMVEQLAWEDLNGNPLLDETRTMRFLAYADGARGVDLTVKLVTANEDVTLGDTKEAGLCAVRLAKQISDHPTLSNSAGATATNVKEEAQIWGKPADWCDESGTIDGKPYGIAIFDHPSNPGHPAHWHARTYGLMAPNEFGLHDFDKTQPKGTGAMKIGKGESVSFRFRVIIHEGDAKAAQIEQKYVEYAKER
jgi:hypothetical protein